MRSADFDYDLPPSAIAQRPPARRDLCRLAVVDRASGQVQHTRFSALPTFLRRGDLLVLNDSLVLPARVPCRRASGGAVEVFLLDPLAAPDALPCFLRPAGKVKFGEALQPERAPKAGAFVLRHRRDDGIFLFEWQGKGPFSPALLDQLGLPPLPPYISRERVPDAALRARTARS
jgi:S-adenosylmethionine:tRNA ribosyltransferase-isomerase